MTAPMIGGVLQVHLGRHVDRAGCVFDDGRAAVHRVLATAPAGLSVRVHLGRAQWVCDGVLDLLAELLVGAESVEIVGVDDRGVAHVVPRLRERLVTA